MDPELSTKLILESFGTHRLISSFSSLEQTIWVERNVPRVDDEVSRDVLVTRNAQSQEVRTGILRYRSKVRSTVSNVSEEDRTTWLHERATCDTR